MQIPNLFAVDSRNFKDTLTYIGFLFKNESIRGTIALGTAWIDFILGNILQEYLIETGKENSLDRIFLGSKIELAYRIGVISKQLYKNLVCINNIRNDLVHLKKKKNTLSVIFWEAKSVQDRVRGIVKNFLSIVKAFPKIRKNFNKNQLIGDFQMVLGIIIHYLWYYHKGRINQANLEPFYQNDYSALLSENKKRKEDFWQYVEHGRTEKIKKR